MNITAFDLAQRFIGIKEVAGQKDHPFIVWCLSTCNLDTHDETPWCSGFVNGICYLLDLDRTNSAWARSWLGIGKAIALDDAKVGFDICIFSRGTDGQGHVGFYVRTEGELIYVLGGNQSDSVTITAYTKDKLLGVRRIYEE